MIVCSIILNQMMVSYDRIIWTIVLVSWIESCYYVYYKMVLSTWCSKRLFFFFLQEVLYLDKLGIYVGWCWSLSYLQTKVRVINGFFCSCTDLWTFSGGLCCWLPFRQTKKCSWCEFSSGAINIDSCSFPDCILIFHHD